MTHPQLKVLLLQPGSNSPQFSEQRLAKEAAGTIPQGSIFEKTLHAHRVDLLCVRQAPLYRRMFYAILPPYLAMACEALWLSHGYDVVVSGSEQVTIFFAILQRFTPLGRRKPLVAMLYWMSKSNVLPFFRIAHPAMTRIVTWSSVQRNFAIEKVGMPAEKIHLVSHPVDPEFWQPLKDGSGPIFASSAKSYICSAGSEMRDYQTMITALATEEIPCRIACREIRTTHGLMSKTTSPEALMSGLPAHIDIQGYTPTALRTLYQNALFVVVPLLPSDTDNGVTVILEAMACGKAVICTKTRGQVDVIRDGETGFLVEEGSPEALRAAILDLWQNPEKAKRMGKKARAYIDRSSHAMRDFAAAVAKTTHEAWLS